MGGSWFRLFLAPRSRPGRIRGRPVPGDCQTKYRSCGSLHSSLRRQCSPPSSHGSARRRRRSGSSLRHLRCSRWPQRPHHPVRVGRLADMLAGPRLPRRQRRGSAGCRSVGWSMRIRCRGRQLAVLLCAAVVLASFSARPPGLQPHYAEVRCVQYDAAWQGPEQTEICALLVGARGTFQGQGAMGVQICGWLKAVREWCPRRLNSFRIRLCSVGGRLFSSRVQRQTTERLGDKDGVSVTSSWFGNNHLSRRRRQPSAGRSTR
jgi:hypothetical protein